MVASGFSSEIQNDGDVPISRFVKIRKCALNVELTVLSDGQECPSYSFCVQGDGPGQALGARYARPRPPTRILRVDRAL